MNDSLSWKDDVPLSLVGTLGALQLGPAAPNIGGAKLGAERSAWAIEDLTKSEDWKGEEMTGFGEHLKGHGSKYTGLGVEGSEAS